MPRTEGKIIKKAVEKTAKVRGAGGSLEISDYKLFTCDLYKLVKN